MQFLNYFFFSFCLQPLAKPIIFFRYFFFSLSRSEYMGCGVGDVRARKFIAMIWIKNERQMDNKKKKNAEETNEGPRWAHRIIPMKWNSKTRSCKIFMRTWIRNKSETILFSNFILFFLFSASFRRSWMQKKERIFKRKVRNGYIFRV